MSALMTLVGLLGYVFLIRLAVREAEYYAFWLYALPVVNIYFIARDLGRMSFTKSLLCTLAPLGGLIVYFLIPYFTLISPVAGTLVAFFGAAWVIAGSFWPIGAVAHRYEQSAILAIALSFFTSYYGAFLYLGPKATERTSEEEDSPTEPRGMKPGEDHDER